MYISKLSLVNYRNFSNAKANFSKGINTIIGENGSGKTNLFRAIRLLLDDNLLRSAYKLDEKDFHRGLMEWRGHWIIISLEFDEVSQDEAIQALFLHGVGVLQSGSIGKATYNLVFRPNAEIRRRFSELNQGDKTGLAAIREEMTIEDYETVFFGRSSADFNDPNTYRTIVGDFDNVVFNKTLELPEVGARIPHMLSLAKEVSFTFVQALRDVVADFQNNRTNPLLTLLKSKSGEIDPGALKPITDQVKGLNDSIEKLDDVQKVRSDITTTIKDTAGETYSPTSLSIKSDLSDEADKLFQSLRLFVGESERGYEGAIHELSLGGANLIYLTLKLLEFKYQQAKQSFANFLLIEEPEAHIHTHIQKTLFDRINYPDTQVIYSTHSTQISEVCNVGNMNILGKHAGGCEVYQPSAGIVDPEVVDAIQRYLDAVRSNLLFAKSVILVEGDTEEILIPILVKKVLGISLDELGISLINIRSTGFQNVAVLFHDERIRKKCAILTDLDTSIIDTTPNAADAEAERRYKEYCLASQTKGLARKLDLDAFTAGNQWLSPFYATHTFEVDFLKAGNIQVIVHVLSKVYKDQNTITKSKAELESAVPSAAERRVLIMANHSGKGWFAILLGKAVDHQVVIPTYIVDAIRFAGNITDKMWLDILRYRVSLVEQSGSFNATEIEELKNFLGGYELGIVGFADVRTEFRRKIPDDAINDILDRFR